MNGEPGAEGASPDDSGLAPALTETEAIPSFVDALAPTLGGMGNDRLRGQTAWLARTEDPDPRVRIAAARQLGKSVALKARRALRKLVRDPNPAVALAAADALVVHGGPPDWEVLTQLVGRLLRVGTTYEVNLAMDALARLQVQLNK